MELRPESGNLHEKEVSPLNQMNFRRSMRLQRCNNRGTNQTQIMASDHDTSRPHLKLSSVYMYF